MTKLKPSHTKNLSFVLQGCETWSLTATEHVQSSAEEDVRIQHTRSN